MVIMAIRFPNNTYWCDGSLSLDSSYAGQHLAFDSFEESTATGGDIADLVLKAELVDACDAVAAADERESTFGSSLGNSLTYSA